MKDLIRYIKTNYTPLQIILGFGILFRLLAVIFSKGFGFFDDHFLIIESSQSWVDGFDYNNWLPSPTNPDRQPQGHPLLYPGIHYGLFTLLKWIGINDPQWKMYFIRLLHAAYSLLIITYGYKITEKLSDKRSAIYAATFLSLFWFMPFLSVRNLAEFVCIPPLLIATWLLISNDLFRNYFLAGLWLGVAFSLRFQSLFCAAGIGIALLINKTKFKDLFICLAGFLVLVGITQGLIDLILWKKPFAEFWAYVEYNIDNATVYGNDVWHMYLDLILVLLLPPLSLILFAGTFLNWKKLPILFWPIIVYLSFHTYFPNKQERFVMTIFPGLIIIGTIGMFDLYEKYKHKVIGRGGRKLFKFSKIFVISLNLVVLCLLSVSYSKENRVEAMYFLHKLPDVRTVMIEDGNKENDFTMPPLFYLGKWYSVIGITKQCGGDSALYYYNQTVDSMKANYVVFWQSEHIEERVNSFKNYFPGTEYVTTIEPSLIDKTLHWMNPFGNDNHTTYIYRIPELLKQSHPDFNRNDTLQYK